MEGLRGVAVLLVFLVHYSTLSRDFRSDGWVNEALLLAHEVGNSGVDLFFVLSGYLIYGTLIERVQPFPAYMARRLRRLYPAFLVVMALYLVLFLVLPQLSKLPQGGWAAAWYVVQNLLLLPGIFPIQPIIEVAWSLSYELFYYLAMPLVIGVCALRLRSRRWRLWFFAIVMCLGLLLAAQFGGPIRLSLFLAGVLLYEWLRLKPTLRPRGHWAGLGWALVGLVMCLPMPGFDLQALRAAGLSLGFGLVCWVGFAQPQAAASRWLCFRPLRWLGNMSYSYYLIHGVALHAFFMFLKPLWPQAWAGSGAGLLLLPALLVTLLVAAVLYLAIEWPLSLRPRAVLPMRVSGFPGKR